MEGSLHDYVHPYISMAGNRRRLQRINAANTSPQKQGVSPAKVAQPAGMSVHSPSRLAPSPVSPARPAAVPHSPPHVAANVVRSPRGANQNGSPQRSPNAGRASPRPAHPLPGVELVPETFLHDAYEDALDTAVIPVQNKPPVTRSPARPELNGAHAAGSTKLHSNACELLNTALADLDTVQVMEVVTYAVSMCCIKVHQ